MATQLDALALLKQDHELVKQLMTKIDEAKDRTVRATMFEQLVDELSVHERIEEELFYPALRRKREAKEDVLEGFEEHHLVDEIIESLDDVKPEDERWAAKFTVLKESVEHHIQDEEEKLFPKAEKLLGEAELGALGVKMADLKEAEKEAIGEQFAEGEEEEEAKR